MTLVQRDYSGIRIDVPPDAGRYMRMREFVTALWSAFGEAGYSWCGFYVFDRDANHLLLAARQPKPACSPIELGGVCGQSLQQVRSLIVDDVRTLGDGNYIACDPRDLSEVVVPMVQAGRCWGVLDIDSHETGAFSEQDAQGLLAAAARAGLCDAAPLNIARLGG